MLDANPELPVEAESQQVLVDGLTIRYRRAGSGFPLVLVHGLLGYSFSWRFVVPILAKRHDVIAMDMPGSGFSQYDPGLDVRLEATARRLLRFLDVLGITSCDVVGSSYGGTTALMLAALTPLRVRKMALVAPANPWSKIGRKRLWLLNIPGVSDSFPALARRIPPLHWISIYRMYGDPRRVTWATLRGYDLPLQRPGVFEHALKIARSWKSDMLQLTAMLPRVGGIPALILWGSKDRLVDAASAEILSQKFVAAEKVVIQGAGHLPYEEFPEEFCELVVNFLDDRTARREVT